MEHTLKDGRGKSPGSRKTQFRAGHDLRRFVRRNSERKPDAMRLLKRMRRDLRQGDLMAFELKLDELKLVLGQQLMVQVQCRYGCGAVISVPASVFEDFTELRHKCGHLTSLKYQVQSNDQKPGAAADRKFEPAQETKPQPSQPAKQLPLMLSW